MGTKTLKLSEQKARSLYKTGSLEMKELLEENFGKGFFSQSVMDRIDTWEDMLAETGLPETPEFTELPERLRDHFQKYYRCVVMTEAYNEGETMDIYDRDTPRHYPYFLTKGSSAAFAFYDSLYDFALAAAGSGSRLALKSGDLAKHVGVKHIDFYREYLES